MKTKILGLLAVVLLAGVNDSDAATYDVTLSQTGSVWYGSFDAPDSGGLVTSATIVVDGVTYNKLGGLTFMPSSQLTGIINSESYPGPGGVGSWTSLAFSYVAQSSQPYLWSQIGCTNTATGGGCGVWSPPEASYAVSRSTSVPEPGTLALLGLGLAGLGLSRRRKAN